MCPDRKLKWFKDHGFPSLVTRKIKQLVIDRWEKDYKPEPVAAPAPGPSVCVYFVIISSYSLYNYLYSNLQTAFFANLLQENQPLEIQMIFTHI